MSVIQACRRLRLEDREFKSSLSNIVSLGQPGLYELKKEKWGGDNLNQWEDQKFIRMFKYPRFWSMKEKKMFYFFLLHFLMRQGIIIQNRLPSKSRF